MISIVTEGMKTPKYGFGQDARKPPSAVLTPKSGATPVAPPFSAQIRAILKSSEVRIPAILTASIQRQARFTQQQAASNALAAELAVAVQGAESLGQEGKWSQRKLAAKLGFCPRTWRRIRSLKVNPADWLPKIHSAIPRLKPPFNQPTHQNTNFN